MAFESVLLSPWGLWLPRVFFLYFEHNLAPLLLFTHVPWFMAFLPQRQQWWGYYYYYYYYYRGPQFIGPMVYIKTYQVPGIYLTILLAIFGPINPFRTAVPFWRQTSQILSDLSPKRNCSPKRVNYGPPN